MKQQNFKKPLSVVLSGIMAISLGGGANLKINAEAASDPSINKFATADQLSDEENFNLREVGATENVYGGKGIKAQKVYFGKDRIGQSQKWYIAGSEGGNLVLFSDPTQPLLTGQNFYSNYYDHDCNRECVYTDGTDTRSLSVYQNHYSSSDLRTAIKELLSTRFSEKEQGMMVPTKIYTEDTKNNKVYYNEDILYPAYAFNTGVQTIFVGENKATNLNSGIGINLNALAGNLSCVRPFWLRAPRPVDSRLYSNPVDSDIYSSGVLAADAGYDVYLGNTSCTCPSVVSASKIDFMSLIFASSASAASSSSSFSNENAMTFRYKDTEGKIQSNATISNENSEITVTKSTEDAGDVYLYIQGKNGDQDWVYSTQITDSTIVKENDIGHEDADLSKCKIWLETFDETDNMTYAKFITEKSMD